MRPYHRFLGLLFVAGAIALAQAQSPDALQVQAELTRQLQREHSGVLVYTEGDQVPGRRAPAAPRQPQSAR